MTNFSRNHKGQKRLVHLFHHSSLLRNFQSQNQKNNGEPITKVHIACVLELALKKSIKPETLINGFSCCGLVPFDPNAVDYSKCLGGINNNNNSDTEVLPVQQQPETSSSSVITLVKFRELVGPSTMSKLYAYGYIPEDDENLNILYRLYSIFDVHSFKSPSAQNVSTSREDDIPLAYLHIYAGSIAAFDYSDQRRNSNE
ncbi:unnamed protein product [Diatraea saccharalis]|uniref:Uncharacterized protein n=1 Tax=Diatraea saccharalis TaxID=40085 RepID=A0A9N9RHR6_9NEOP|nr:unnamed protein product [Diatraea saccharalis]